MNILVMLTGIDAKFDVKRRKLIRFKIVDPVKAAIVIEWLKNLLNLDSAQVLRLQGEITD